MTDGQRSAALQLIEQAATAAKTAESVATEARHELDLLKGEVRRIGSMVEKHEALIDGNGAEGLKERLSHAKRTADGNRSRLEVMETRLPAWGFWKDIVIAFLAASGPALAIWLTRGG